MTSKRILQIGITLLVLAVILLAIAFFTRSHKKYPLQVDVFSDVPTVAAMTQAVSAEAEPVPTLQATTAMEPVETEGTAAIFNYPDSFHIDNIVGHKQAYSLGCEAAAAVDWAGYFGVTIIEYTFQVSLPHSDNPDYGFVGDVNSVWGQVPPYAYGVHSGPVADLLNEYGLPAKSVKGYTLDEVRQQLSEGKPIIAWVIGRMVWSPPETYTDSEGRLVTVAAYEHVVILTGYDVTADTIRFMSNGVFYDVPTQTFLTSWEVLGNMAVIYDGSLE